LRGLTQSGGTFLFAENRVVLDAAQIAQVDASLNAGGSIINTIPPGTYTNNEWCGACFYEKWMFVNLQTPSEIAPTAARTTPSR
jgi:uncharacterized protein